MPLKRSTTPALASTSARSSASSSVAAAFLQHAPCGSFVVVVRVDVPTHFMKLLRSLDQSGAQLPEQCSI
jgi:hypothetical protein